MDKANRLKKAMQLKESATRLVKLLEIDAPEFIIEGERKILNKRLFELPVNSEAQIEVQNRALELKLLEDKFMLDNGFYKDIV